MSGKSLLGPSIVFSALALSVAGSLCACAGAQTAVSYQGAVLQPGDVIDLHRGVFTLKVPLTDGQMFAYGHTAMYLGRNPDSGIPQFFSFDATSYDSQRTEEPYHARILNEAEFLAESAKHHPSFDVYRLKETKVDPVQLWKEAEEVAQNRWYGKSVFRGSLEDVCSGVVTSSLAKATGLTIPAMKPDDFATSSLFQRHPALSGKSISVEIAQREAKARVMADLEEIREQERKDAAAVDKSQGAVTLAVQLKDRQAEEIARRALDKSQRALARARRVREALESQQLTEKARD